MVIPINFVFEDDLSEAVMTKIVNQFDNKYYIGTSYPGHGFGYIKSNINGFNNASKGSPFFVLTDLDTYPCPVALIQDWLKQPKNSNFIFRIAVREVEAWLLADVEGFSQYIGVSSANFPQQPENERDPKQTLLRIVKKSRSREIKEDILPRKNAKIGPNYNGRLMDFVFTHWNIEKAMEKSESLTRAYNHLKLFKVHNKHNSSH